MAKDGLLPKNIFASIHPVYKTPWKSTVVVGAIVSIVSALTPIDKVSQMTSIGTLLAFSMICAAVWILRKKEPSLHRPYKVKWLPLVAIMGIGFNVYLMFSLDKSTWIRLLVWSIIGFIIYFAYSARKSNLRFKI